MARVLVIEDDASLLDMLSMAFEDAGHQVETASDGLLGLERVKPPPGPRPDVVVSDINLPGLDGFTLVRRLRERGDAVPIVLLTSRDSEIDEALGLELGADDYITKPFSTRILLARVEALLRRQALMNREIVEPTLRHGALELWPERLEVRYAGVALPMTVTEIRLLEAFMRRPSIVLSRDRLLSLLRDDGSVVANRIIDTYVRRIRRRFEAIDPAFDAIETVVGAGYRWKSS